MYYYGLSAAVTQIDNDADEAFICGGVGRLPKKMLGEWP